VSHLGNAVWSRSLLRGDLSYARSVPRVVSRLRHGPGPNAGSKLFSYAAERDGDGLLKTDFARRDDCVDASTLARVEDEEGWILWVR
jgi:hypothetical protein